MMLFLSFAGMITLFFSKIILALGEVLSLCAYLTFNQDRVIRTRDFFDEIAAYVLVGIDRQSFRNLIKLQSNSQVFYQSIPMLVVSSLIFTGVLQCQELLEYSSIYISFVSTIFSLVAFFIFLYLDKLAADESFMFHFYEGMTAYINWLPHLSKIQLEPGCHLNFGVLKTSLSFVTRLFGAYYSIDFKFTQASLSFLTAELRRSEEKDQTNQRRRINIGKALNFVNINDLVHFVRVSTSKHLDIIFAGYDFDKLFKNAKMNG